MAIALSSDASVFIDLLSKSELAVTIKDVEGRYVFANSIFLAWVGHSADAMNGLTDADLFQKTEVDALHAADQAARQKKAMPASQEQRVTVAGARRDFLVLRSTLQSVEVPAAQLVVCVWKDLTHTQRVAKQLESALQQIEQQQQALAAMRREDQNVGAGGVAAGVYQRAQFDEQLRREVDLSLREHREIALVAIRVDPMPDADASAAEEATNRVPEALAHLLRSNTRAMDASCRVDQTRFAVLLSGVGLATAHSRMEGLRRQCASHIIALNGASLGFTVSMGVASFPHTSNTEQELWRAAEDALQEACKRGGNHVALATIRFENN